MRRNIVLALTMLLSACVRHQANTVTKPIPSAESLALSPSAVGVGAPDTFLPPDIIDKLQPEAREQAAENLRAALEAERGQRIDWHDAPTGASGYSMTLRRGFDPEHHRFCSEVRQAIRFRDQIRAVTGYACRQPGGIWAIDPTQKQYLRLL